MMRTRTSRDTFARVLAVALPHYDLVRAQDACLEAGIELSATESLAGAFSGDTGVPDAVLVAFDGSVEAERRLERLPTWLSAGVIAVVAEGVEELIYHALKCGADEAIEESASPDALIEAVRRAMARKSVRDYARARSADVSPDAPLTLVQESAEGLIILDHDGAVRFANDTAEALLGAEPGTLTGKPFRFPVTAGEPITTDLPGFEGSRTTELRFIETEWGGVPARIGSLSDVTVRRELERAVDALEDLQSRMASRDHEFVAEFSATIRRPLTNIVGFSELMLSQVFGPLGDERYLNYIRDVRDSGLSVVSVLQALENGRKAEDAEDGSAMHPRAIGG